MARVTRFDLRAEDHFQRLFVLFDLLDDEGVTGKVGEVLCLLNDSLPAGDRFDLLGASSEQVYSIATKADLDGEEFERLILLVIEGGGISQAQGDHILRKLNQPLLFPDEDVSSPEAFDPYGLTPKSVLLLRAVREAGGDETYVTQKAFYPAFERLNPSAAPQGVASLLWRMSERGLLAYNRFAMNSLGIYLFDFNARLTPRFVRFLEGEGVEIEDLEKRDEKH